MELNIQPTVSEPGQFVQLIFSLRLSVEKEGFQTEDREGIALSPSAAIAINLLLVVGNVSVHVAVEAGVPVLDTTSSVGGVIAERSLTELPLDGRDLFKAAVLQLERPQHLAVLLHYYRMGKRARRPLTVWARNGADNGDGTGDLVTADKGFTYEHHGIVRVDHNFSSSHSLFARYVVDASSSLVHYFGTPPGTYVPGFPVGHEGRNQYFTVQDRRSLGRELFNELRFGINRTTASTSSIDTHPGLPISLLPDRAFGMLNVLGMGLIGNSREYL